MIVCPICESQVQGFECEVCGKDLSGALGSLPPAPVTIEKLAELEVTIPERVGEIPIERAPDVELTALPAAGAVAPMPMVDFEKTVADKIGEIPVLPIDDLSEDRVPDDGVRTAIATGPLTCRYCKTVQALGAGLICERCGMKLPQAAVAAAAEPKQQKKPLEVWTRCRACAAPALAGGHCRECGRDVPIPEV